GVVACVDVAPLHQHAAEDRAVRIRQSGKYELLGLDAGCTWRAPPSRAAPYGGCHRQAGITVGQRGQTLYSVRAMIGRACVVRRLTSLFLLALVAVAAPQVAWDKKLTLPQLLELARGNPGLMANAAAISASEAQVTEAKMNWLPQGGLLRVLAPAS